ncbi:SprT-like domain-containing protein [Prosthecobacter sp.]|uniref:SprT family zinc-dependent metalloprotease n=1 Tax=Prosthecobacter sp. TaxID=1965333 RepID=UPI0037841B68
MLDLSQLSFDFSALPHWVPFRTVRELVPEEPPQPASAADEPIMDGRDPVLEEQTRAMLLALDMPGGARLVTVTWNARLRSTAGYARYPGWAIELNPLLRDFEGQVERTLKHELAHLIAYHRSGRRRIEPHGREWRQACADLGIPGEKAQHRLPLPRNEVERKLTYACPVCQTAVQRVRKFRRPTACLQCCNRHAGGKYDGRFRLVLMAQS